MAVGCDSWSHLSRKRLARDPLGINRLRSHIPARTALIRCAHPSRGHPPGALSPLRSGSTRPHDTFPAFSPPPFTSACFSSVNEGCGRKRLPRVRQASPRMCGRTSGGLRSADAHEKPTSDREVLTMVTSCRGGSRAFLPDRGLMADFGTTWPVSGAEKTFENLTFRQFSACSAGASASMNMQPNELGHI